MSQRGFSGPAVLFVRLCLLALAALSCSSDSTGSREVAAVTVTPASASVAVGATVQLSASPTKVDGQVVAGVPVVWTSETPSVATVSSKGVVTGVSPGAATITASSGGHAGQATITVTGGGAGDVLVNVATHFQTMDGWEAVAQIGETPALLPLYRDTLLALATADLGINRLRVEVRSGAENTVDYWTQLQNGQIDATTWRCVRYSTVNDDADPNHINPAGFHFSELDYTMDNIVLPMKRKMEALGRRLYLNVNYVAFTNPTCSSFTYVHDDPAEYAEFALAVFQHLQQKYAIVPDYWEMILEPDNSTLWASGTKIGQKVAATVSRLAAAGYHPQIIAPSTTSAANAAPYFLQIQAQAPGLVSELSYHRYSGASTANLQAIAQAAQAAKIRTAMLEHIGADYGELLSDLEVAEVSAWQQYALAYPGNPATSGGGVYYAIDTTQAPPRPVLTDRARYLRQYFRYVRWGAVRVGAASTVAGIDAVAFLNPDGRAVFVAAVTGGRSFTVQGLPPGTYGVRYTTATATDVATPDQTIAQGQLLRASIPGDGVLTVFAR